VAAVASYPTNILFCTIPDDRLSFDARFAAAIVAVPGGTGDRSLADALSPIKPPDRAVNNRTTGFKSQVL
jgi:hypothetical protein